MTYTLVFMAAGFLTGIFLCALQCPCVCMYVCLQCALLCTHRCRCKVCTYTQCPCTHILCFFFCTYAASLTKSGSSVGFSSLATTPSTQEQILKNPPLLTFYSKLARALTTGISWLLADSLSSCGPGSSGSPLYILRSVGYVFQTACERRWGVRG